MPDKKKTCFVVMGFGEKTDFQSNPQRVLNLNKTYEYIIEPAVRKSGLECIRADTIIHSTVIDKPMYEQLLGADLVIADLSTSNANAIYELGVRHALRPHTTIVMAESNFKFPFDFSHLSILQYEHMGKGIDHGEVQRVILELKKKIAHLLRIPEVDSPVFLFIPSLADTFTQKADKKVVRTAAAAALAESVQLVGKESFGHLMNAFTAAKAEASAAERLATGAVMEGLRAVKSGVAISADWLTAIAYLKAMRKMQPDEPYLIQQLALATYKSEVPDKGSALNEARTILEQLLPATSTDAETVGLWGAIHKRLWDLHRNPADLDQSIRAYARGYFIRNDYYNGINFAFLLDTRAAITGDDALADRVVARRIRREVLALCEGLLAKDNLPKDDAFWVLATRVEALAGLGDVNADKELASVSAKAPQAWMAASMVQQVGALKALLS